MLDPAILRGLTPVAVGCIVVSCKTCDPYKQDLEQFCNKVELTTNQYPGYSDIIVVKEGFVFKVPKELETSNLPLYFVGELQLFTFKALEC